MNKNENNYIRSKIVNIAQLIFERQLTDSGGGNISVKYKGNIYFTPTMSGEKKRWELQPDDLIVASAHNYKITEGESDMLTRESSMHMGIYKALPEVGAVLHAHPRFCLVYASAKKTMPVVTENFEYFSGGQMECCNEVPAATTEMAEEVISYFCKRRENLKTRAIGVLIPRHGIVIAAKDIDEAFVLLENSEVNAMVALFMKLL